MKFIEKIFGSEDSNKEIKSILEHGKSLLEKNFYDWASVEFSKALEIDPEFASVTITKLFQEMQGGGNLDGILSLGINVLKIDPKNIELANLLGNIYRKKHNWNQAKNMYKHCLKHDSKFKYAIYNLAASIAKVEIADGQAISAISDFEKMSDFILPEIKDGIEKLKKIQKEIDLIAEQSSMEEIDTKEDEMIEKDKNEEKNQSEIEEMQLEPVKIFKYITTSLKKESDQEKEACFALGLHCLNKKEGGIAQSAFKRLLMREKENTDLRCFLVLAISLEGDLDNAIKTLQGILGRKPNHRYTNVNIGILLKNKGYTQQARVSFFNTFKLLERSQGDYNIETCLEKAEKLFNEKREKKALEIYEPIVNEITSKKLLTRIAQLNLNNKFLDNALEIYRRILRKDRQNIDSREGIKSIYAAYLLDSENFIKKKDPKKAAEIIDKALKIAITKNLLQKAISINRIVENENRVIELEKKLEAFLEKEMQSKIQEKIKLAEEAEKVGNYKNAILCFEEAIKIQPKNNTLKKMVDLCVRIKRPDLVEKFTNWFLKLQKTIQEKEKAEAREKFEMSKKNAENNKEKK